MRAIAYFRFDPEALPMAADSQQSLTHRFQEFCSTKSHSSHGVFAEHVGSDEYQRMVDQIKQSKVGYLIAIPTVEHMGDTFQQQVSRVLELDALSCQVVCINSRTTDPLQSALAAVAGDSSKGTRRERIREGMRAKAAQGIALGRPPYGYRIGVGGVLTPQPKEAPVVQSIFRMYLDEALGVRSIARRLNESGMRTRRGQQWSMVTVRDILRNHAYIGTYQRFGLRIAGSYEAIIETGDFRKVQEQMQGRSPVRRQQRNERFLLSGLLFCGYCGRGMMGVTRRQTWRRKDGERRRAEYRYYQCQSRINRSQCQYHTVRASDLEDGVLERLRAMVASGALTFDSLRRMPSPQTVQAKGEAVSKRYVELVQRAVSSGAPLQQLRAALAEIDGQRRSAGTAPNLSLGRELGGTSNPLEGWDQMDIAVRQDLLRSLVARVTFKNGRVDVVLHAPVLDAVPA